MTNKELEKQFNALNDKFDKVLYMCKKIAEENDWDFCELVENEPKPKFCIGDKVKSRLGHIHTVTDMVVVDGKIYCNVDGLNSGYLQESLTLYEESIWQFSEDEKVILRNLSEKYNWIVRDEDGWLSAFELKPKRDIIYREWKYSNYNGKDTLASMHAFEHLFQSIQWTDTEPCNFRKFI